ncbi:MAG: hypothetical protein U1A07_11550 [Phenylobacterium sp.]|jgi:hypothetical protein|nr:hypothetical protein [Phenylobacterium sp.]MDZ4051969.1 hypothetical protein [Phenylobacterium sp.]MDZ4319451.1 hypothetical protein [Phenylobacterium sp.]
MAALAIAMFLPGPAQGWDLLSARQIGLSCKRQDSAAPWTFQIDMFRNSWCSQSCSTKYEIDAWDAREIRLRFCEEPGRCALVVFDRFKGTMKTESPGIQADSLECRAPPARRTTLHRLLCEKQVSEFKCTQIRFTGVSGKPEVGTKRQF